jgi:hypothetical protein
MHVQRVPLRFCLTAAFAQETIVQEGKTWL